MRALAYALPLIPTALWADAPKVAVDIAPVHSIVAAVMDGVGTPDLIVRPGASPHGYSMRPSEARALDQAEVVVWIGPGLTPWLDGPIDALADSAAVMTLMDVPGTELLPFREGAAFEGGHEGHDHGAEGHDDHDDHDHEDVAAKDDDHDHNDHDDHGHDEAEAKEDDHDHGHDDRGHDDHGHEDVAAKEDDHDHGHDDHGHDEHGHEDVAAKDDDHDHEHAHDDHGHDHAGGMDPHAWLDPHNAEHWAEAIAAKLSEIDPENADTYAENAAAFAKDVEATEAEVAQTLASIKGKPFVVFHDAYQYFEGHFGVSAVGAISATDAASPSAARVAEVRDRVADLGAVCALTEPQFNPGIADAIGAAKLGEIDPLGAMIEPGAALYAQLLKDMAASLSECLS